MRGLSCEKNAALHRRSITSTTFHVKDEIIMVEGILRDERCVDSFSVETGEKIPPFIVHEIILRLLVEGPELVIRDLEVDMKHVPRTQCDQTRDSLRQIIGQRIAPGFSDMVKKNFGGPHGCAHLNALLLAMAPSCVQGYWAWRVSKPLTFEQASRGLDERYLIDTCWVWRSGGDLERDLRARSENAQGSKQGNTREKQE
ncbi:MAG TPA: DUF2889 domain-containing protein [Deltaproteobacteria bacterium]|nr:DUF2889 domain-containing protein [Deltaproteobacteria bacterium]